MTDKEKLECMLPYSTDSFEDIVAQYIRLYIADFTPSRLRRLVKCLDIFLDTKIKSYEMAVDNSLEKASYLKSYLEGKMWKDEEHAKANIGSQIANAESMIYFWHLATGKKYTEGEG
jgi:SNF2 family DNA or RNA helicase